mmetsp:Transcript_4585/g.13543  ORF Transcript_4585/g.13543 Transcript_4585/m.13543 type:complete len:259 (-) Transcript_4585:591-1367(-)
MGRRQRLMLRIGALSNDPAASALQVLGLQLQGWHAAKSPASPAASPSVAHLLQPGLVHRFLQRTPLWAAHTSAASRWPASSRARCGSGHCVYEIQGHSSARCIQWHDNSRTLRCHLWTRGGISRSALKNLASEHVLQPAAVPSLPPSPMLSGSPTIQCVNSNGMHGGRTCHPIPAHAVCEAKLMAASVPCFEAERGTPLLLMWMHSAMSDCRLKPGWTAARLSGRSSQDRVLHSPHVDCACKPVVVVVGYRAPHAIST